MRWWSKFSASSGTATVSIIGCAQSIDRAFVLGLALMLLVASGTTFAGLVVQPHESGPTLSLDTCHPAQSLDQAASVVLPPPMLSQTRTSAPALIATLSDEAHTLSSRVGEPPDPPPPKRVL